MKTIIAPSRICNPNHEVSVNDAIAESRAFSYMARDGRNYTYNFQGVLYSEVK